MTPDTAARSGAFHRVCDGLDLFARVIAGAGLIGMVVVITLQVLFRYFLNQSLAWTEEMSRFLFVITCLIAITVAHRRQMHAGYSSLVTKLPIPVRRTLIIAVDLISIAFFVVVGFSSRPLIEIGFESLAPATGIPMAWIYLVFPLFGLLGVVFSIEHIVLHLHGGADVLLSADEDRAVADEMAAAIGDEPADGFKDGRNAS
jgi:TRAP-type C4-dicarboxylate transport system permease small subunit